MSVVKAIFSRLALVFVWLLEHGYLPDVLARWAVRRLIGFYLSKLNAGGDVEKKNFYKQKFVNKLREAPIATHTKEANEQHYERPTEFMQLSLGKRLKYSSCVWPDGVRDLDEAEEYTLNLACERAQIEDGMSVLDLGCGWGSFGLYVAEMYPKCKVMMVSNSNTQRQFIEGVAEEKGFTNVRVVTADANHFQPGETFDRIVSNEMFEHMKNYQILMENVSTWLRKDGLLFIQILCHREYAYSMTARDDDWMGRKFFTGGTMPSADLFLYFQEHLKIQDMWLINGRHYARTLDAWLDLMDANKARIMEVFEETYGTAAQAKQEFIDFRTFYFFCSESFGYNKGNDYIVAHYTFAHPAE